jgi:hypothetical protein
VSTFMMSTRIGTITTGTTATGDRASLPHPRRK